MPFCGLGSARENEKEDKVCEERKKVLMRRKNDEKEITTKEQRQIVRQVSIYPKALIGNFEDLFLQINDTLAFFRCFNFLSFFFKANDIIFRK